MLIRSRVFSALAVDWVCFLGLNDLVDVVCDFIVSAISRSQYYKALTSTICFVIWHWYSAAAFVVKVSPEGDSRNRTQQLVIRSIVGCPMIALRSLLSCSLQLLCFGLSATQSKWQYGPFIHYGTFVEREQQAHQH
jgi:hypothetical protein